jgi:nucleoside-diphosphate-sugar epimerase
MKVLITGSSGFIGGNLSNRLNDAGYDVVGYDLPDRNILDPEMMRHAFDESPDVVVHMAAQAYIPPGEADPFNNAITNVAGTVNVLERARECSTRVVCCSSGAVYGSLARVPTYEEIECDPESHYGVSKLAAEMYAKFYHEKRGVPVTMTRFSSVYGAGRPAGPINAFVERALKYEPITIFGDGQTTRDYTYVDDVVEGLKLCIDGTIPYSGEVYNLASGTQTSLLEVVVAIEDILGKKLDVHHEPEVPGDIRVNYFDIEKARRWGYSPKVSLTDGIEKMIEALS